MAYNMLQSNSGHYVYNESTTLQYGSAKLTGFLWEDYTCLQPLDLQSDSAENLNDLTNSTFIKEVTNKEGTTYNISKEKAFLEKSYEFQYKNKCSFF